MRAPKIIKDAMMQQYAATEKAYLLETYNIKNAEEPWGQYNSTFANYLDYFRRYLEPKEVRDSLNKNPVWLDFMGQAAIDKDDINTFQHRIGVTLLDNPYISSNENTSFIFGDVFRARTWRRIKETVSEVTNDNGVDIISCSPNRGFWAGEIDNDLQHIYVQYLLHYHNLTKLFDLLSVNGQILIEIKEECENTRYAIFPKFIQFLLKNKICCSGSPGGHPTFFLLYLKKQHKDQKLPSTRYLSEKLNLANTIQDLE